MVVSIRNIFGGLVSEGVLSRFESSINELFIPVSADARLELHEFQVLANAAPRGLSTSCGTTPRQSRWVYTAEELSSALQAADSSNPSRILVLHRFNSWSRIDITGDMFTIMCAADRILPGFLKIVQGFKKKCAPKDEAFTACYSQCSFAGSHGKALQRNHDEESSTDVQTNDTSALYYNLRFFERHGRALDDPFSCRQSAIHQRLIIRPGPTRSSTIIIQPPKDFIQQPTSEPSKNRTHPLHLHLDYISGALASWRDYLNHISDRLRELDMEVSICRPYGDFGLDLASKQRIHALRQKLFYAQSIALNFMDTCRAIKKYAKQVSAALGLLQSVEQDFYQEFNNHISELQNHLRTIAMLLDSSYETKSVYDDILKSHQQELLHKNGLQLAVIAQSDAAETRLMASLANKTYRDSRTMRIATLIATLYLPANLVLGFFSTTLVWFEDESGNNQESQASVLRVHGQVWVAIVSTVIMAAATMIASWWWDRRRLKLNIM